jgi:RHS repeat-associated protein
VISRRGPTDKWVFQFSEARGTRFTTDEDGNFLQDLRYSPYGRATSTGAQPGTPEFTTDQWNEGDALDGLGLVHLGARIYDPATGRFLSRDPLLIPRSATTSNPYAFGFNDPVNFADPTGLDPCGAPPCGSITASSNPTSDDAAYVAAAAGVYAAYYFLKNWAGGSASAPSSSRDIAYQSGFNSALFDLQAAGYSRMMIGDGEFLSGFATGAGNELHSMGTGFVNLLDNPHHAAHHALVAAANCWSDIWSCGSRIANGVHETVGGLFSGDAKTMAGSATRILGALGPGSIKALAATRLVGASRGLQVGEVGAYGALRARSVPGDMLTPHHMPQAAMEFTARAEGGSLVLHHSEHVLTRTYGGRGAVTSRMEQGMSFRSVLARDMRDIRKLFGSKYSQGLRDLLQYYKVNFPELMDR